ncbi:MAG: RNA 2',3'-cyclic phosphodiesterase [Clostridia bacterium]|nr:RNA 2',3'-cyclic phosphodiesterase [Clostridia bacterium]
MRVFIAINLEEDIKGYLRRLQNNISQYCHYANFTRPDNFHITLKFIGEIQKDHIAILKNAMDEATAVHSPFYLQLNKIGCFDRRGSKIIWAGLGGDLKKLKKLYICLENQLKDVEKDSRVYSPHITLARQASLTLPFDKLKENIKIDKKYIKVKDIYLMQSTRENRVLTYRPIAKSSLKQ